VIELSILRNRKTQVDWANFLPPGRNAAFLKGRALRGEVLTLSQRAKPPGIAKPRIFALSSIRHNFGILVANMGCRKEIFDQHRVASTEILNVPEDRVKTQSCCAPLLPAGQGRSMRDSDVALSSSVARTVRHIDFDVSQSGCADRLLSVRFIM
jgi:hypothetical protein